MLNKNNLVITAREIVETGDWNQSNWFTFYIEGVFNNMPFDIYIDSRGMSGYKIWAQLDSIYWLSYDNNSNNPREEQFNKAAAFSTIINDFIKFIDEVEQNPWRWA